MIHKETVKCSLGYELFVYMNGSLLYKRWSWLNYGKVFGNQLGGKSCV